MHVHVCVFMKAEDFGDDTSFPDMAIQRLRKDSSSGSEFEFELPQVKKKTQDSNLENDSAQPSKPEPTTEQKTVLQDSAEQKSVSIETSQETVKDGNMANITTTTKKIIQYEVQILVFIEKLFKFFLHFTKLCFEYIITWFAVLTFYVLQKLKTILILFLV